MLKYILQRLAYGLGTLFLIVSITFFLLQIMPGSPFNDEKLDKEQVMVLNEKYGLNDPVVMQYFRYMSRVFRGDFGVSFRYHNRPVTQMISSKLLLTVQVGFQALFLGVVFGILFGAVAALNRNSFLDHFTIVLAIIGVSVPPFVMAAFLQLGFTVNMKMFPVVYNRSFSSTILPSVSLSFFVIASTARFMRTELVEVLNSDFILLARAKGVTKRAVVYKHALRNALIPVITIIGPMTVSLITGSTVIEYIFGVPGLGNMLVEGIRTNDYFVILGCATFYSALFIIVVLTIDILYGFIDPRIRIAGGQ